MCCVNAKVRRGAHCAYIMAAGFDVNTEATLLRWSEVSALGSRDEVQVRMPFRVSDNVGMAELDSDCMVVIILTLEDGYHF